MFIFTEHIRKLTIEFLYLFEVRLSNTLSILPFQGSSTLGVFLMKYLGFALTSPTKLFTYKSCCFLTSALISLLKVSKFDLSLLLSVFFCLCMSFIFPANLPSHLRCNPGNGRDRPVSFRWKYVYPPSLE